MPTAYKGKGKTSSKGKGKGFKGKGLAAKSKGYGKGFGNKGYKSRPGELSLEDRRKKLEELKKKTKCQACGQFGHWAGDSTCPKRKAMAHLEVCADGVPLLDTEDLHGVPPQSLMAVRRGTKQRTKEKDRARSPDKIVHVTDDQVVEVTGSDLSPQPQPRELRSSASGAIVPRASSEEWMESRCRREEEEHVEKDETCPNERQQNDHWKEQRKHV